MQALWRTFGRLAAWAPALLATQAAQAAEVQVAVAANFAAPMRAIAAAFERDSGHKARLAIGATGAFYAQIRNGAPFEILLAADASTPARLVAEGLALGESRRSYATGRLMLWSAQADAIPPGQGEALLRRGDFQRLAIANPRLAPYGAAAVEAMDKLGLSAALKPKLVQGENIAQTYQFVASGNAQLGFVALSQVWSEGRLRAGSGWLLPESLHAPIRQELVLLKQGARNAAARALLDYLQTDGARATIRSFGYGLD